MPPILTPHEDYILTMMIAHVRGYSVFAMHMGGTWYARGTQRIVPWYRANGMHLSKVPWLPGKPMDAADAAAGVPGQRRLKISNAT